MPNPNVTPAAGVDSVVDAPAGNMNLQKAYKHSTRVFADRVAAAAKVDLEALEVGELDLAIEHCEIATSWLWELSKNKQRINTVEGMVAASLLAKLIRRASEAAVENKNDTAVETLFSAFGTSFVHSLLRCVNVAVSEICRLFYMKRPRNLQPTVVDLCGSVKEFLLCIEACGNFQYDDQSGTIRSVKTSAKFGVLLVTVLTQVISLVKHSAKGNVHCEPYLLALAYDMLSKCVQNSALNRAALASALEAKEDAAALFSMVEEHYVNSTIKLDINELLAEQHDSATLLQLHQLQGAGDVDGTRAVAVSLPLASTTALAEEAAAPGTTTLGSEGEIPVKKKQRNAAPSTSLPFSAVSSATKATTPTDIQVTRGAKAKPSQAIKKKTIEALMEKYASIPATQRPKRCGECMTCLRTSRNKPACMVMPTLLMAEVPQRPRRASKDNALAEFKIHGEALVRKINQCVHVYEDGRNCGTTASFGYDGGEIMYCAPHKLDGMIRKYNQCVHVSEDGRNCGTTASCGYDGGEVQYCAPHKLDGMINLVSTRCIHPGCGTIASCGYDGGEVQYCAPHKLDGMINLVSTRCIHPGCGTIASCGYDGGEVQYCAPHKLDGMINLVSTRCIHPGCGTIANQGYDGGEVQYCAPHKLDGMVNLKAKRCIHPGCGTIASCGYDGGEIKYCAPHKLDRMVNLKVKPCLSTSCTGYASSNCPEQYCLTCYLMRHPNSELANRYCAKERHVMIDFKAGLVQQGRVDLAERLVFNKSIAGGVSSRRPDGRVSLSTHSVILEVDENQASYHVEPVRDALLAEGSQGNGAESKPTAFLRLNPDGYRDSAGSYHESAFEPMDPVTLLPFVPDERMPDYQKRIQATVAAFIHLCDHRPAESITVQYLYYNGHEEEENAVPSANEL